MIFLPDLFFTNYGPLWFYVCIFFWSCILLEQPFIILIILSYDSAFCQMPRFNVIVLPGRLVPASFHQQFQVLCTLLGDVQYFNRNYMSLVVSNKYINLARCLSILLTSDGGGQRPTIDSMCIQKLFSRNQKGIGNDQSSNNREEMESYTSMSHFVVSSLVLSIPPLDRSSYTFFDTDFRLVAEHSSRLFNVVPSCSTAESYFESCKSNIFTSQPAKPLRTSCSSQPDGFW